MLTHLLFGDGGDIRRDSSQQSLLDVGVEMRLELMPIDVLASDDEIVEDSLFLPLPQILSDVFVVMQDFIVHAAFGMAGIVSRETVPAAPAGQSMEEGLAFFEFVEVQIKNARPVAVHKGQPQAWLCAQD